jgi:hypothetical protein
MTKRVLQSDENKNDKKDNSITIKHFGRRRYSSKVEYYEQIQGHTPEHPPVKKYQKKNILRAKSVKCPEQNLLVMKWDPPIKLSFD